MKGDKTRPVQLYRTTYANGDRGSGTAFIEENGTLKIEVYECGDELEKYHGDWDREFFITVTGDYPPNILELLVAAGEAWRRVLNKYNLSYQEDVW